MSEKKSSADLSPLAQVFYEELCAASRGQALSSPFLKDFRRRLVQGGALVGGDELGEALEELVMASLVRLDVHRNVIRLRPRDRFAWIQIQPRAESPRKCP